MINVTPLGLVATLLTITACSCFACLTWVGLTYEYSERANKGYVISFIGIIISAILLVAVIPIKDVVLFTIF